MVDSSFAPEEAADDIITDSYLRDVLGSSAQARDECIGIVDKVSKPGSVSPELEAEITQQQKSLYMRLAQLRGENRNGLIKVRETKQKTAEARQEVDRLHLQLQNLYYEERHLRGEIAACESYEYVLFSFQPYPSLLQQSTYNFP